MQKGSKERQQMFLMIEGWKSSGLTQRAYCKEHNIGYHIFHYWYKVYRDEHNKNTDTTSPFVELQLQTGQNITPTTTDVELLLPDGRRLLFRGSVNACFLRLLLQ